MNNSPHGFAPLEGDFFGFTSTPRSKRNRRFNKQPVKMRMAGTSPITRRASRRKHRSCLVSNSLSYISFLEELKEPESMDYWATNESEPESLGQLSYSAIEPNLEIIKTKILLPKEEEHLMNDNSTEDESDFSRLQLINYYDVNDLTYLSEDERYARIDDDNIHTVDDSKVQELVEVDILSSDEETYIIIFEDNLTEEQVMNWITQIFIEVP